jgi:ATP-binding cassette subfamily F protein uup
MTVMAEGDGRFGVYAGGYSDMVAQRGDGVVKTPPKSERKSVAAKDRPLRESAAKLSFSDQHALNTLPARIETSNRQITTLQAELSDPKLYSRDPQKFAQLSQQLAERVAGRDADEELWLALEIKREALAQQAGK